jgi:hypothetical protein
LSILAYVLLLIVSLVEDNNVIFLKNNYFLIEKLLSRVEQAQTRWNRHTYWAACGVVPAVKKSLLSS